MTRTIEIKVTHRLDDEQFAKLVEMLGGDKVSPPLEEKNTTIQKQDCEEQYMGPLGRLYFANIKRYSGPLAARQSLTWCSLCRGSCMKKSAHQ